MVNLMLADSIRIDYKDNKATDELKNEVVDLGTADGVQELSRLLGMAQK